MRGARTSARAPREAPDRNASLDARPVKCPVLKEERKGDKVYVTVEFERPAWQRWLGAERRCRRTFGLDAYGRDVYEACDGNRSVRGIVGAFAQRHRLSEAEARKAVTAFMKTLMMRGLIGMALVDRRNGGAKRGRKT